MDPRLTKGGRDSSSGPVRPKRSTRQSSQNSKNRNEGLSRLPYEHMASGLGVNGGFNDMRRFYSSVGRGSDQAPSMDTMGNANSTTAHFDTAKKTGTLSLNNSRLNKVPDGIQQLQSNLRSLDLGSNKFGKFGLPEWISGFQTLKTLLLVRCELIELPQGIGNLKSLETLNVSHNSLTHIPSQIGQLKKLKTLTLTSNKLTSMPSTLSECSHLEMLDISENQLVGLPETMGKLNLIEMNANRNRLSDVPNSLHSCPRLKTLRLEENCLSLSENLLLVLSSSSVSLICLEGNVFNKKQLEELEQFQIYMERFTATKKKMF